MRRRRGLVTWVHPSSPLSSSFSPEYGVETLLGLADGSLRWGSAWRDDSRRCVDLRRWLEIGSLFFAIELGRVLPAEPSFSSSRTPLAAREREEGPVLLDGVLLTGSFSAEIVAGPLDVLSSSFGVLTFLCRRNDVVLASLTFPSKLTFFLGLGPSRERFYMAAKALICSLVKP